MRKMKAKGTAHWALCSTAEVAFLLNMKFDDDDRRGVSNLTNNVRVIQTSVVVVGSCLPAGQSGHVPGGAPILQSPAVDVDLINSGPGVSEQRRESGQRERRLCYHESCRPENVDRS